MRVQYLGDWKKQLQEQERQQRVDQREQEKLRKARSENSRIDHEKTYQSAYFDYVDLRLEAICEKSPADYIAFERSENQQKKELEKAFYDAPDRIKKNLAEINLRVFNQRGQKVVRAVDFFKDKETSMLDFWQWDKEINSEK